MVLTIRSLSKRAGEVATSSKRVPDTWLDYSTDAALAGFVSGWGNAGMWTSITGSPGLEPNSKLAHESSPSSGKLAHESSPSSGNPGTIPLVAETVCGLPLAWVVCVLRQWNSCKHAHEGWAAVHLSHTAM